MLRHVVTYRWTDISEALASPIILVDREITQMMEVAGQYICTRHYITSQKTAYSLQAFI
jgi:hypothetical protein